MDEFFFDSPDPSDPRDAWWLPFPARLTELTEVGSANLYSWYEVDPNASTGFYAALPGGRRGTSSKSPAWEINNLSLDVSGEPFVLLHFKSMRLGQPEYEFTGTGINGIIGSGSGSGSGSGDDFPCVYTGVSDICPVFTTIDNAGNPIDVVTGIEVEYSTVDLDSCVVLSQVTVLNPGDCSGVIPDDGCRVFCGDCYMPEEVTAVVEGLEDADCTDCDAVNGTWILTHVTPGDPDELGSLRGCTWRSEGYDAGCGSETGDIILYRDADTWHLQMGIGANGAVIGTLQGEWDCRGPNVFTFDESDISPYCAGDVTVTITSTCSDSSGSGEEEDIISDCCPGGLSNVLNVTLNGSGGCSCVSGTYEIINGDLNPDNGWFSENFDAGICGEWSIRVYCDADDEVLRIVVSCDRGAASGEWLGQSAGGGICTLPLSFGILTDNAGSVCCSGSITATLTG